MNQIHQGYEPEDIDVGRFRPDRPRLKDRITGALTGQFLNGLLTSKRFYAVVSALLVKAFGERFGLDEDLATLIVQTIASWIIGDSIRPTTNVFASRRFWVMVATIIGSIAATTGLGIDSETIQQAVLAIAAWIMGDAWRETLRGPEKQAQVMALRHKPYVS